MAILFVALGLFLVADGSSMIVSWGRCRWIGWGSVARPGRRG
jgi:hypothetical protein